MTVMASRITGQWSACSTVCWDWQQGNIKGPRFCPFVRGIYRWTMDSPRKGTVAQKMFAFDDIIMQAGVCLYLSFHSSSRADSRFAPSQWEMMLLCNDVSHWLGANLESALIISGNHPSSLTHWSLGDEVFYKLQYHCSNWVLTVKLNMVDPIDDVNIGSGNGLVPSGSKPLPEPTLTQITLWHHLDHNELTAHNKNDHFIPLNLPWYSFYNFRAKV